MYLLSLLYALAITGFSVAEKCYWPNGKEAEDNWVRCPGRTHCCASGEACLSNNLCYEAHLNIAYRGACSDISWPLSTCPRVCYEEVPDLWANMYACPNNTNQVFTCGRPGGWVREVCNDQMATYTWDPKPTYSIAYVELPSTSANASSSATTTPVPTSTSRISSTRAGNTTPTSERRGSSGNAVALGAGLGVGLGVPLLLVSLGFLLLWSRTRKRAQAQAMTQNPLIAPGKTVYNAPAREMDGSERPRELQG
ncbi:uncharacterized protein ATNIH1004_003596 [Aspergillus tanneri]|uniref:Mid2 domain-containing protein n=1 Tax=Aspergillus tanneri TaxID=1220188 RepID=A0A5M9MY65_9EURO|nr:uncharacterized protein ATNIH1004_003596 [Aspergillus tanneri]KAA8650906.1 hypothetical protein ATNIH1004_003596 [Aspergillus tanneri]